MISLKVLEAYTRDVGRGVCRIDYASMDTLNISTGDVVKITVRGNSTVSKVFPLYPSDEGKEIMRIDGLGRNNLKCKIGDKVKLEKEIAVVADKIYIKPLEAIPPIDERYIADALDSVPVMIGDKVMLPYFGGRITFEIIKTIPDQTVIITNRKTIVEIVEEVVEKIVVRSIEEKAERFERLHEIFKAQKLDIVEFSDELKRINERSETLQSENKSLKAKLKGTEAMLKGAQKNGLGASLEEIKLKNQLKRLANIIMED